MLEHLRDLRTNWKDEFPDHIVHSDEADREYKVRRSWFEGVISDVENLLTEEIITDSTKITAAERLLERFTSKEFIDQELTTAEDIATANRLIDIILGE